MDHRRDSIARIGREAIDAERARAMAASVFRPSTHGGWVMKFQKEVDDLIEQFARVGETRVTDSIFSDPEKYDAIAVANDIATCLRHRGFVVAVRPSNFSGVDLKINWSPDASESDYSYASEIDSE
jgi:hypothetical protein